MRLVVVYREEDEVEESDGVQSNRSNDEPSVNENSNSMSSHHIPFVNMPTF